MRAGVIATLAFLFWGCENDRPVPQVGLPACRSLGCAGAPSSDFTTWKPCRGLVCFCRTEKRGPVACAQTEKGPTAFAVDP